MHFLYNKSYRSPYLFHQLEIPHSKSTLSYQTNKKLNKSVNNFDDNTHVRP